MVYPFVKGKSYLFRTITNYLVGKVVKITGNFIELKEASWIADTGRFSNCIKDGTFSEVEPVGTAYLNTETIVDAFPWKHKLPTKQK